MVVDYAKSLLNGLGDVFAMFRSIFDCLPMAVQALIYLAFGGFILLCILRPIVIGGGS